MGAIEDFFRRHSVLTYIGLTFAISWGGDLRVVGGPDGSPDIVKQLKALSSIALPAILCPVSSGGGWACAGTG